MSDTALGPDGNAIGADGKFDILNAGSGQSPVAAGGTITFQYLPMRASACYGPKAPAILTVRAMQGVYLQDQGFFTIVYGPTSIVVTWLGSTTIPANANVSIQLPLRDTSGDPVSIDEYGTSPDIQIAGF